MDPKRLVRKFINFNSHILRKMHLDDGSYHQDGLHTAHNHEFMTDPAFQKAYARGVLASDVDYLFHWRVHIGLWAAYSASKIEGDFVECGVNKGFLSSAIMKYLDWDTLNKTFYLMDTFCGIDARYVSDKEIASGTLVRTKDHYYTKNVQSVRKNFSEWKNVEFIVGAIPETLSVVETKCVAFLHIDMNCAAPEVAAFEYFWSRLAPGAFVLFDDYAYKGYNIQKNAMDYAVAAKGMKIVSLPTGQGLLIKSP